MLDLYSNRLIGEIPSSLGSLILLKRLYLSSNKLAGGIPASLMQLSKLDVLDLSNNLLTGSIPSQISNLTLLAFLWLSSNELSGPIPHSIYGIPSLTLLFLKSNSLTGEARLDLLLELKGISRIDFSSNAISSVVFPKSNASITQIGMLSLDSCNLTEVPQFLENQNSLDWLSFSNNNISGHVPQWLMQKPLQHLDLSLNNIQGTLPIPSTSINYYLMSNNQLYGEVPSSICELKGILLLDLADNEFTGALPPCLCNFSFFLFALSLSGNNFVGKIPDFNNGINFITVLDLSSNSFEGPLPKSLLNCSVLKYVNLGKNKIVDTFPSWLGSLPSLKVLMLHSNGFYGEMKAPRNDSWFPSLQVITLSDNNMAGILPSDYFAHLPAMKYFSPDDDKYPNSFVQMVSMTIINKGIEREFGTTLGSVTLLDLSSNNFNGTIPDSIGDNLLKLHTLNLSDNYLTGQIPLSLANLKNLEVLDLSRNRLSGVIPGVLGQITSLSIFNVSYNNLSGYIPGGNQFGTFENSSYIGNPELCGTPLTKKCGNVPKPPSVTEDGQGDTSQQLGIVWITALVGLAGGLMIGVALEHAYGANFLSWLAAKWHKYQRRQ
ncbi:hypothetical protein MLD38_005196 [Melastoma candidum]|nr:hypothetical protein MLD38_005196 [Melastoma candidum]